MARNGDPIREQLRRILVTRRTELSRSFANRRTFAESDRARVGYGVIRDLESGARSNFDPDTLLRADITYGFEPGSIERFLNGGPAPVPVPAPGENGYTAEDQAAEHLRQTPGASAAEVAAYLAILHAFGPAREAAARRA